MAKDTKVSEFTELTTVLYSDAVPFISDPDGTPRPRRAPISNFLEGPEIRVVADDAPDDWKKHAHYQCTGDGDDEQIALAIAAIGSSGNILCFSPGTFVLENPITLTNNIRIRGCRTSILKANAVMDYVLGNIGHNWIEVVIDGLTINGNSLAVSGMSFQYQGPGSEYNLINIYGATGDGVYLRSCMALELRSVYSHDNGGDGFGLYGTNATVLIACRATDNGDDGFYHTLLVVGSTTYSGGLYMIACGAEGNTGHGVHVYYIANPATIVGSWVETNLKDGIRIDSAPSVLIGCRASGCSTLETTETWAIHILDSLDTDNPVLLQACKAARIPATGDAEYGWIYDEGGHADMQTCFNGGAMLSHRYENSGSASIADGASIDHGLYFWSPTYGGVTPTSITVTGSVAGEILTVSAPTTAHFHVDIKTNDGSAGTTQTVYWRATYVPS